MNHATNHHRGVLRAPYLDETQVLRCVDDLNEAEQERLTGILEDYLAELERGAEPDSAALIAEHPDLAGPLENYFRSLDLLHQAAIGPTSPATKTTSPLVKRSQPAIRTLGDYRLLREIGRGGMGIVYEAEEMSLKRRVALKVLPFAAVLDQQQIARFRNEAQAAAQLHHNNIVPVFSVGSERGVHYYAMQFIDGQTIDQAIRQLRRDYGIAEDSETDTVLPVLPVPKPAQPWSGLDQLSSPGSYRSQDYMQTVARIGKEIAEALQHAHDMGVIHRDIKPSNLMLDQAGKVWITDFGLARITGDKSMTATGDVLGTVRYMSPEQAAGRSGFVDSRTDVYSLGISLYELLTLQDVFEGSDHREFLDRIRSEEPRAPRRINSAIPADLETIVLKAISKEPKERYETAQDLADDLQRFLDGVPTHARRPTALERLAKWSRRHRRVVTVTCTMILLALAGSLTSTIWIVNEKGRTEKALAQAQADFARAEANLRAAHQVVDRFGARTAEELAPVPGAERLRQRLLADTLQYYQAFAAQSKNDPSLLADLALTQFKIGSLASQLGESSAALQAYEAARRNYQMLSARDPDNLAYRSELALCHNNTGLLLANLGRLDEAHRAYDDSIAMQMAILAEEPDNRQARSDLARAHSNRGILLEELGRREEAETDFLTAIGMQQQLLRHQADNQEYISRLATSYHNLAFLLVDVDPARAKTCCRQALELQTQLITLSPRNLRLQRDQALSLNNLGSLESRDEDWASAVKCFAQATDIGERLVDLAPEVTVYRQELAISQNNLAQALFRQDKLEAADAVFVLAQQTVEQLLQSEPAAIHLLSSLGGILHNRGMLLERLNRHDEATVCYGNALESQKRVWETAPQTNQAKELLSLHLTQYGRLLRQAGRWDEAAKIARLREQYWPDDAVQAARMAEELALSQPAETSNASRHDPAS